MGNLQPTRCRMLETPSSFIPLIDAPVPAPLPADTLTFVFHRGRLLLRDSSSGRDWQAHRTNNSVLLKRRQSVAGMRLITRLITILIYGNTGNYYNDTRSDFKPERMRPQRQPEIPPDTYPDHILR